MFCKKSVRKNLSKFTRKHLCQSLFSNKVADLWHRWLWHRCFPVNFEKFLRTQFFIEHLRWLLLNKKMANVNGVMSMFLIKVKVHFTHNFLTFQKSIHCKCLSMIFGSFQYIVLREHLQVVAVDVRTFHQGHYILLSSLKTLRRFLRAMTEHSFKTLLKIPRNYGNELTR